MRSAINAVVVFTKTGFEVSNRFPARLVVRVAASPAVNCFTAEDESAEAGRIGSANLTNQGP